MEGMRPGTSPAATSGERKDREAKHSGGCNPSRSHGACSSVYGKDEAQARGVPAVPSGRTRSNGEAHLRRRSAAERRRLEAQVGQRLTLPMHCQWLLSLLPIPCSRGFG